MRNQAAGYCGLSLQGVSEWVKRGIIPRALPGTKLWDLKAIDIALDRLIRISETPVRAFGIETDVEHHIRGTAANLVCFIQRSKIPVNGTKESTTLDARDG